MAHLWNFDVRELKGLHSLYGRQLDRLEQSRKGQVEKVTRVESHRCLAKRKTGKTRTSSPG